MALILSASITAAVRGQTSYPMTLRIDPVAVERGHTAEITVTGRENWNGAWAFLCQPEGLRGEVTRVEKFEVPQKKVRGGGRRGTTEVKGTLQVASDAPLGPRELRVATPQGVSSVGVLVVVDDPVVAECDDQVNDRQAGAQRLVLPAVVSGQIGKLEDVDWYAFDAVEGERVTFEVWGNRLDNKIHDLQAHLDPILTLHDQAGRELAAADNNHLADPVLSFKAPASATYYLQVRDTTYSGNVAWPYALHAVTGPATMSVFPLAANPGATQMLEARGPGNEKNRTIEVIVPRDTKPGVHLFSPTRSSGGSLPVALWVTPLRVQVEDGDAPSAGEPGKTLTLPVAQCGRLAARSDTDGYRFDAKKGLIYAFEVVARRAASECDPVLRLLDQKGTALTEVDDARGLGKDSRIEWSAPADGTYVLQVADLHDRGGDAFGYVVLAEAAQPDFTVTCDPDMVNVGPGGRVPVFVRIARRHGLSGPVDVRFEGLPAGVSASPLVISPSMSEGVIVVSATPEAKRAAALLSLKATARAPSGPITREAEPTEEIYLPGGGRGHWLVDTLALGVTDPSDITLEACPREIVLTPGESAAVDVTVTRNARYEGAVNLAVVLQHLGGIHANPLPPGVTVKDSGAKTLLGPKETKGRLILQAAPTAAECDRVPIAVMGHVSINFVVKTAYASAPILVSVKPKRK
jgi:hypothetical protein